MNYELTEFEEKTFLSLIKISSRVLEIYKDLIKLETEVLNNSSIFNNIIKYLNEYIAIEDKLFSSLITNINDAVRILERVKQITKKRDITKIILENKELDLILNRIYSKVNLYIIYKTTDNIEKFNKKIEAYESYNLIIYTTKFLKEINLLFLIIINKYINDFNYYEIKNDFIKFKYYKIFIDSILEENLIQNNFNIPYYFNSNIDFHIDVHKKLYIKELIELLHTSSALEIILKQIKIRSLLIYLSEKEIEEIYGYIEKYIESNKELQTDKNNKLLLSTFNFYKIDKNILRN